MTYLAKFGQIFKFMVPKWILIETRIFNSINGTSFQKVLGISFTPLSKFLNGQTNFVLLRPSKQIILNLYVRLMSTSGNQEL